ncbi:MAG: DUF2659 family protein, partial [Pseudomonadota bacterium]
MADILDEALSDEKDEKKIMLFRKIFPIIITLTVIIAIAMGGFSWYQNRLESHNQKVGDMLVDLISGEYGEKKLINESLDNLIQDGDNRQVEMAEIQRVVNLIESGDSSAAFEQLESIIANTNYNDITRSFARLLWLNLILDEKNVSDELKMKARNHMQYFKEPSQVFFTNATLLKAVFYKKNNQSDLAAEYANTILDLESASLIAKEQARAIL